VLLHEPLNRYETNLSDLQADAAAFLHDRRIANVKLLCDLFHMSIEEADLGATITACADLVGHVHRADSNRRAIGRGHTGPRATRRCGRSIDGSSLRRRRPLHLRRS
jgi:sugar phosphate isomerase/epimerase